ncbi:MAG: hydrogenase, partial [Bacteroidetes bacterium]
TGCTHNRAFIEKVDGGFGKRAGCLFYEVGCRGPMTRATCNRILWNRHSSKTRANHPCLGCTEPGFPHHDLEKGTIFKTPKFFGIWPKDVPTGESRLTYYFKAGVGKLSPSPKILRDSSK